ncbi:unnamed protein product [Cyprideis torosa]|uniref:Uncharacterized protein n=1 Tax=Cyprideis torosa TaxID=163714 RepID=A0A7R8ZJ20_9CRUS|nr:unnamed protein product [Cyprideis torosa]CAG0887606.1 unnamed protein product [Cyprideis torosa]
MRIYKTTAAGHHLIDSLVWREEVHGVVFTGRAFVQSTPWKFDMTRQSGKASDVKPDNILLDEKGEFRSRSDALSLLSLRDLEIKEVYLFQEERRKKTASSSNTGRAGKSPPQQIRLSEAAVPPLRLRFLPLLLLIPSGFLSGSLPPDMRAPSDGYHHGTAHPKIPPLTKVQLNQGTAHPKIPSLTKVQLTPKFLPSPRYSSPQNSFPHQGHAHLADFNVAVMVDEKDADTSSMSGTKPYMAPEIFECALGSAPSYSFNVDWWSLGIVAYELLRGKRPFDIHMSSNIDDIRALIREPLLFPTSWSSGFTDLVSQLLTLNPGKRVSSVSALQSVPCLSPLDFTAIEATRVPATFVPPKGQLNCDPTFELEEMIIESRPLHKKKKRLARQRSHLLRGQSMDVDSDCEAIPVEVGGVSAGHTPPQHSSSFESAVPPSIKDENFIAEFPTYNRIYELAQRDKKLLEQRWENELEAAMKACDPISEVTLKRPSGSEPGSRRLSRVVEEDDAAAATKGGMSLEAPGVAGDKGAAFPPPPSPASPQRKAGTSSPKTLTTPPPSATEKHKKRLRQRVTHMGLLSAPQAEGGSPLLTLLRRFQVPLQVVMYLAGVIWFALLAYEPLTMKNYFSENALLPGLVEPKFIDGDRADRYLKALELEAEKGEPQAFIHSRFLQLGLDTGIHNFTLNYPYGNRTKFTGRSIYGILRAPRHASTESIVLTTPFRTGEEGDTSYPAVAMLLALAELFRTTTYWAKDIIFLVADQEQLGVQAWLEAYHRTTCGAEGVLIAGDLEHRAGSIQAAVNLEIPHVPFSHMEVKVEGLNGQLPNLDLVNLAHRLCNRERVVHTFKGLPVRYDNGGGSDLDGYVNNLYTLSQMVLEQAVGVPNGNHGLFLRFGISAITMESRVDSSVARPTVRFRQLGRVLEGIVRSLNNLLERFHQSFFFYLMLSSTRFVSIAFFFPPFAVMAAPLLIRCLAIWPDITGPSIKYRVTAESQSSVPTGLSLFSAAPVVVVSHLTGLSMIWLLPVVDRLGASVGFPAEISLVGGIVSLSLVALTIPSRITRQTELSRCPSQVLIFLTMMELAAVILLTGVCNISLGVILCMICVPVALLTHPIAGGALRRWLGSVPLLLCHPLCLVFLICCASTWAQFPDLHISQDFFVRGRAHRWDGTLVTASKQEVAERFRCQFIGVGGVPRKCLL